MLPLFEQNKTVHEIAILTGAAEKTVQNYRYRYNSIKKGEDGLSLRAKVEELVLQGKTLHEVRQALPGHSPISIDPYYSKLRRKLLPPDASLTVRASLEIEAEDRGMTVKELADKLLSTIAEHELFSEILDTKR